MSIRSSGGWVPEIDFKDTETENPDLGNMVWIALFEKDSAGGWNGFIFFRPAGLP
jgi:hypothetical protein